MSYEDSVGDMITIRIPAYGVEEALPLTIETYKKMVAELGTPEAANLVITQLVALARLLGADISEENILSMEAELLRIYNARRPRPQEKV